MGIISGSIWGSFQGWGSFRGRDHFGVRIISGAVPIPLRFYFRDVLEQLKTYFHTNFHFKRVLGFVNF